MKRRHSSSRDPQQDGPSSSSSSSKDDVKTKKVNKSTNNNSSNTNTGSRNHRTPLSIKSILSTIQKDRERQHLPASYCSFFGIPTTKTTTATGSTTKTSAGTTQTTKYPSSSSSSSSSSSQQQHNTTQDVQGGRNEKTPSLLTASSSSSSHDRGGYRTLQFPQDLPSRSSWSSSSLSSSSWASPSSYASSTPQKESSWNNSSSSTAIVSTTDPVPNNATTVAATTTTTTKTTKDKDLDDDDESSSSSSSPQSQRQEQQQQKQQHKRRRVFSRKEPAEHPYGSDDDDDDDFLNIEEEPFDYRRIPNMARYKLEGILSHIATQFPVLVQRSTLDYELVTGHVEDSPSTEDEYPQVNSNTDRSQDPSMLTTPLSNMTTEDVAELVKDKFLNDPVPKKEESSNTNTNDEEASSALHGNINKILNDNGLGSTTIESSSADISTDCLLEAVGFGVLAKPVQDDPQDKQDAQDDISADQWKVLAEMVDEDEVDVDMKPTSTSTPMTMEQTKQNAIALGVRRLNHHGDGKHRDRKLDVPYLESFLDRDVHSTEEDGEDRWLLDYDRMAKNLHLLPVVLHFYVLVTALILRNPDKKAGWSDVQEQAVKFTGRMSMATLLRLVFASCCFVIVHWHHLLYICLGGSVRNPNNLLAFWCVKHLILHGCGVVIFKDSKYAISTMVAFALMAQQTEHYINDTLQLEGGLDALMEVFRLKSVLIASRKVARSLGRLSPNMKDPKILSVMKSRISRLKPGNAAFILLLKNGDGKRVRDDLNTFLKKENHEIPMYLTTWRLRFLAAQKTGLLIRLNCCETPEEQLSFNKRLVAELWTVAKIDASGWEKMSLVQIMSLDDEWLQKKGLWDGTGPLPKTDDEVTDVVRNTNWTKEDVAKALRMFEAGSTHPEIGEELGRTQRSVEAKMGAVKKQLNSTGNS